MTSPVTKARYPSTIHESPTPEGIRARCPECGEDTLRPIAYGLPSLELMEAAGRGEVVLGGCVITPHAPAWACTRCRYQGGTLGGKANFESVDGDPRNAERNEEKDVSYGLGEHRHRFAVWAAGRASQRGFTTVRNLRQALEATTIRQVLSAPETMQLSADQFDAVHRAWCSSICSTLGGRSIPGVTYGRAAKLVAVYLKAIVIMGEECDTPFGRNLHPPIDRVLLRALASSARITSPHKASWRLINWTQLDESRYEELIAQLRSVVPDGVPFWTIEEYWQPSDSSEEAP
jgi:hypothetical protein